MSRPRPVVFGMVITIFALMLGAMGCSDEQGAQTPDSLNFAGMSAASSGAEEEPSILVSSESYPCTITDYLGHEVTLEAKPERVAVLSGSFLSMWYALGGESICRTNLNTALMDAAHKDEIDALPSVGPIYNASVEAIVELQPDLIIAQAGVQANITPALERMGFKVVTCLMQDYDDVTQHLQAFGTLLGASEAAQQRIADMDAAKKAITDRLPEEPKKVVILYITATSLSVKLDNSIAGDVAGILGLTNIASGLPPDVLGSETTPLDIEYVVQQNPDYVLVASMISSDEEAREAMEREFASNPALSGIEAIKAGRAVYLPQAYFLYNAGHEYVRGIEYMAKGVYPEIYGALE